MIRAFCEDCQSAQEVTPTEQPVGATGTARRWQFKPHMRVERQFGSKIIAVLELCEGSRKLV